ncbi:MAG: hypothetical protein QM734_01220 [Cyclobacteriaceae bacterium]
MNFNSIKIRLRNNSPKVYWAKQIVVPKIFNAKPISISKSSDWEIHALVSKRDFLQLLWALYSFFIHVKSEVGLVVHSDGSLAEEHKNALMKLFPGATLIMRQEADEVMEKKLVNYSNCLKFRSGHVTNLKVLDFWLLSNAKNIVYFDSDLIFLNDPKEIFTAPPQNTFLKDIWTNYCVSVEKLNQLVGFEVEPKINIGFGCIRKETFQLDFIESMLNHHEIKNAPYIADQTILAAMASRDGLKLLDGPYQMVKDPPLSGRTLNHYTNVIRHKMYTEAIPWLYDNFIKNKR